MAGQQQHLAAACGTAFECRQQHGDGILAPMQRLRHQEAAIVVGQLERLRRLVRAACFEVAAQALQALIALIGIFFQQALDDRQQLARQVGECRVRPVGTAGNVAMHEFHRVARLERRLAGQQFVEGGAERIEIGAPVDPPIHAPRLFRRHVTQGAFQGLEIDDAMAFVGQFTGDAEIGQLQQTPIGVPHQIGGIDVLVDHAMTMDRFQRRAQLQRDVEKIVQRQRRLR